MCPRQPERSGRHPGEDLLCVRERARQKQVPRLVSARERACTFPRDDRVFRLRCLQALAFIVCLACTLSCSSKPDPNTLVMIIESSPTNLDPRVGLDAQSERIDDLIFDDLLTRDDHLNVRRPGGTLGDS